MDKRLRHYLSYKKQMKGLVILAAVVTVTSAQVGFSGVGVSSGSNINSNNVDSQINTIFSTLDRDFIPPQGSNGNFCRLPDGSSGSCIKFSQCSPYSHLFSVIKDQSTVSFLQARICRLSTNSVQICCPIGDARNNPNPTSPAENSSGSRNPMFPTDCGESFGDRIILGTEVAVGAYPWLVAIGREIPGETFNVECGGSLITSRHVLTAAHCFARVFKPKLINTMQLVDHRHTQQEMRYRNRPTIFTTGDLSPVTSNDQLDHINLGKLKYISTRIQPICLPFRADLRDNNFVGSRMNIAGWGKTSLEDRDGSEVPLEARVEVVTLESCKKAYESNQPPLPIVETQLCAGTGGADTCRGDSGGPLIHLDLQTGRYYLVGVTSFGRKCGSSEFPGVYGRVGSFLKWLEFNVS
ncbi:unnamed protein product, partial [Meganyctiphanes norvegica]